MSWNEKQKPQRFVRYAVMLLMVLTLGVGQMWADETIKLYYQKDMPSGYYSASSSADMTKSSANSNRYYCRVSLQNGSYGFYIKWGDDYYKVSATASSYKDILLYNYGSSNYGNSSHRVTYSTGSAGYFDFMFDISNNKINVAPESGQTVKIAWSTASGHDNDYNLGTYTTLSQDESTAYYYYVDIDLTAVKHYMFVQTGGNRYWKGTSTLTENSSAVTLYDYGTSNYGDSKDKINFTPSTAAKYRFRWNNLDRTVKLKRLYNISYQAGDYGSGSTQTDYKVHGTAISLRSSGDFTRTGYNHTAWNTNSAGTGGTSYAFGASYTSNADLTLYPTWTAKTTTVTLQGNAPGGQTVTGGGTQVTATYDSALPSFSALTCTGGYALKGYYTETSGGTKVINADGSFAANSGIWNRTDGSTLTLHAQWSLDRTLTYDGNTNTSGNVPAAATTYSNGTNVTVLGNVDASPLVKTGYTFTGWNTSADGNGISYAVGSTITMSANYTLYAQWSENMTTVNFVASPTGAGTFTVDDTPSQTSTTVGVTTTHDITAVPYPGYCITGSNYWTAQNANISLSNRSTNPTTVTGGGTASTSSNLTATFTQTYAYIQGRMTVYNAARNSKTHVGSSEGGWSTSSTNIKMNYDGTNHRFYLHTYMKPSELSTAQTDGEQYFFFKTSTNSSSLTGTVTTYRPSEGRTLTAAGTGNKKATETSTGTNSIWFDSETTNGYAILYFDEAGVWYELEHKLLYNGNGNTGGSTPSSSGNYYDNGTNATAATNTYTMSNYSFAGWNTSQHISGTNYAAGASVPMTTNRTLYATWTRSVTLEQEDATTDGSTSVTGTWNCSTLPSITNPSKTGYTFDGWYTDVGGGGNLVINTSGVLQSNVYHWTDQTTPSNRFMRPTDKDYANLYAKWIQTVTLNANTDNHGDGSNTTATIVYKATAKTSITHCTAATGYHLVGYYTAATGGTKVLNADGTFAGEDITDYIDEDGKWVKAGETTLYAHYEPNTYDVILNVNGATSGSNQTVVATFDADMPTTQKTSGDAITAPEKTGHTFGGYYANSNGTGTQYYTNALASEHVWDVATNNTHIYAKWTANTYTLTLDDQDATSTSHKTSIGVIYGTSYYDDTYMSGTGDVPTKTRFDFKGWYTGIGGTGDQIIDEYCLLQSNKSGYTDADGKWIYADNLTLHAKWERTISLNSNYGASFGSVTVVYNRNTNTAFTPVTRTGYLCSGYYTGATDGVKVLDADGSLVEDVEGYTDKDGNWVSDASISYLYPHWTPITYTIAFDPDNISKYVYDAEGSMDPIDATYDAYYLPSIPANTFTREGYTFYGWAKTSGGDRYYLDESAIVKNLSTTNGATATLYAVWQGNNVTVNFNARGGTIYTSSKDVRVGSAYGTLPSVYSVPVGYAFVGWFTSATGGTEVTEETVMTATGAHTLYAHYVKKSYVYFKNTIGWDNVFVTYDAYWDSGDLGAGNLGKTYHHMTQIPGTDVYYDEVPAACVSSWKYNIAFNNKSLSGHNPADYTIPGACNNFNSGEAVFRVDFDSIASMFVPRNDNTNDVDGNYKKNSVQYISTGYTGESGDPKYTSGYWQVYNDEFSGYTITLEENSTSIWSPAAKFNAQKAGDSVFVYTVTLKANKQYNYAIYKKYRHNGKSDQFRYGSEVNSGNCTDLKLVCEPNNGWMQTTASGEYKFKLALADDGHMYLSIEYPLAVNDYRVLYSYNDGEDKEYASEVIKPIAADTIDTISVFVHKLESPVESRSMKIQKCTGIAAGVPTWTDVSGGTILLTDITKNGVYDFAFQQFENGDNPTGEFIEAYDGDYYIRTTASDGGWDWYLEREDNKMIYSAYSMTQTLSPAYSHYYCQYVGNTTTDITYAIATKYSPNISGTMIGDATIGGDDKTVLPAKANIRFSWNEETNAMRRAYLKDAQGPTSSRFLVLHGADGKVYDEDGAAISAAGDYADNELVFSDMGDWQYEVKLQAQPDAQCALVANYNGNDRNLVGNVSEEEWMEILGGEGSDKYGITAIYDFKTNRLMMAWTPGESAIEDQLNNVDMLWVRYRDQHAQQITFTGDGSLTNVKVVAAIRLKYNDLVGHVSSWTYETRPLMKYFLSFPFDVNVSDIFGLNGAELGREYVIQKYNGAERAKKGLFLGDGDTYWENLTIDSVMHANEGYCLIFDNEYLNGDLGTIWENKGGGSSVYLYFPAADKIAAISDEDAGTTLPGHVNTDSRSFTFNGGTVSHANMDSHWNLVGSPLFLDSYIYSSDGENPRSNSTTLDSYYEYDAELNYWSPTYIYRNSKHYTVKAMHALLVQFAGSVTWSKTEPAAPAAVVAHQKQETTNTLITMNLLQNGEHADHAYVKMSDGAAKGFELCEDLFKVINNNRANIFAYADECSVAYSKVPVESQTVNLGVVVRKNGTYTFSMPENVIGQVILIDNFAQTRTNLNIEDYEVTLNKGNYYDRFSIEINVNNAPTAIDGVEDGQGTLKDGKAHKFIMDQQMYILQNGMIYDAQGRRVQ